MVFAVFFKINKLSFLAFSSILLIGCSSTPTLSALDSILDQTETNAEDRSVNWYIEQDSIRASVLNGCYDHFTQEVINRTDTNVARLVFDMNEIEKKFHEYQDCKNALEARDQVVAAEHKNKALYQYEIEQEYEKFNQIPAEEIERLSAQVAMELNKDSTESQATNTVAEQQITELLAPEGKVDQIMQLSDEDLKNADLALQEMSNNEVTQ